LCFLPFVEGGVVYNHKTEVAGSLGKRSCITHSPRKPKTKPTYEIVNDREERDDDAQADMQVVEVTQPGVDGEARWTKKAGKSVFGYLCPVGISSIPWLINRD
jgi:hypothetical protein